MTVSFNGSWDIDLSRSKIWDYEKQEYIPDIVGGEKLTINTVGDVQTVYMTIGVDPVIELEYVNRFGDQEWSPYIVKSIAGHTEQDAVGDYSSLIRLPQAFEVGRAAYLVKTIYIDERCHYRISANAQTGFAEHVMQRRLSEDGQFYVSSVMRPDGVVDVVRTFVRV